MSPLDDIKLQIDEAKLATVNAEWSKKTFPYPNHRLYYATAGGEATLILNNSIYTLKAGYLYLIPAFSMVETICEDYFTHYYIHFKLTSHSLLDLFTLYEPWVELLATSDSKTLFKSVIHNIGLTSPPYASMVTTSAFYQLIAPPFFKECSTPDMNILRFEPVLNYIDNHLDSKITNKTMAATMKLDPVYFNNLFSKTFGMPPVQYVIKKRLEKAQTLLHNSNYKVKEIASLAGFDNSMYFSRIFKQKNRLNTDGI